MKFSKIFARACGPEQEPTPQQKPPELEFYLKETGSSVELRVRDVANNVSLRGCVLIISKNEGHVIRCAGIHHAYGLPLDNGGRLKFNTER